MFIILPIVSENGTNEKWINTDKVESAEALSKTRSRLVLSNGKELDIALTFDSLGEQLRRVNVIKGHVPIPKDLF